MSETFVGVHRRSHRLDRARSRAGVLEAPDLTLGSAVSRSAAGRDLGEALGGEPWASRCSASVAEALDGVDVLIDYTSATAVKATSWRRSAPACRA